MSKKNHLFDAKNHFESQKYAWQGLALIFKNEQNFRIQLLAAFGIVCLGYLLDFTRFDWIATSLLIGLVLISEAFNSVVEAICDTISTEYKVSIKYAKDVSAGAVLISSMVSIVSGSIIILPKLIEFLQGWLG